MRPEIHEILAHFLSYRERTAAEIRRKLQDKGIEEDEIEEAVQEYTDSGLIDDENFAFNMISFGLEKGQGLLRIRRDADKKGISEEDMERAILRYEDENDVSLKDSEEAAMDEMIEKFISIEGGCPSQYDDRALSRLAGRLSRAGHDSYRIYDAIREIKKGSYDD